MTNYKMIVSYDGSRYNGWQRQENTANTIQGRIEAVLEKLEGTKIEVIGAGRTDAGVHAYGQVINVKLSAEKKEQEILAYLNEYLPEDIGILSIEKVSMNFHSRLNAVGKTYLYRIRHNSIPNPFTRKYTTTIIGELDIKEMRKAATFLVGTHDFKSFCSLKKYKKSTIRTIYDIEIKEIEEEIRISIHGNGFLYHMVRIIVGTLIEVGNGKRKPEKIKEILEQKDRQFAGITAPPQGLFLVQAEYK